MKLEGEYDLLIGDKPVGKATNIEMKTEPSKPTPMEAMNIRRMTCLIQDSIKANLLDTIWTPVTEEIRQSIVASIDYFLNKLKLPRTSVEVWGVTAFTLRGRHNRIFYMDDKGHWRYDRKRKYMSRRRAKVRAKKIRDSMCFVEVFITPAKCIEPIEIKANVCPT